MREVSKTATNPRRRALTAALVLCAFIVSLACGQDGLSEDAAQDRRGRKQMETIGLDLRLAKEKFIFWESMPVNVTVSNKGDAAIDLPQGEAIPITYEFRSPSDGETKASVLATNRWEMLTRDKDSPPREISEEELEPGKTRELVADPVLYAMKGLPPRRLPARRSSRSAGRGRGVRPGACNGGFRAYRPCLHPVVFLSQSPAGGFRP